MTAVRVRKSAKSIRNLGLLASASMLSLLIAGEAQAACVANPVQPLNNITTPSTTVTCTGINNAGTIFVSTNGSVVEVQGAGSTLSNGNLTLNGNFNTFNLGFGATVNNIFFITAGSTNAVEINGQAVGIATAIQGTDDSLLINATAAVTARTGDIDLATSVAGQNQAVVVQGALTATSGNGTDYLLTGGTGNQSFTITGTLTGLADGRLINGGDGDDKIFIGPNANVSNGFGGAIYFEGGAGTDELQLNGTGNWNGQTTGVERLIVDTVANNGLRILDATGSYSEVFLNRGSVAITNSAALGLANSTVTFNNSGQNLIIALGGPANLNHNFVGAGTVIQNGQTITYGGNSSAFGGIFRVAAGTAVITSANAFGTAAIENNSVVQFGDLNLANNISGTGQVVYAGIGTGDMSGNNSFSGGIDIQSGSLRVANVNALGTGTVTTSTGGVIFQVDNATDQVLANNLTGALILAKTNTGILDVTGTNSYTGGTLIDNGAIRVDAFSRLGTGQVIANANGSLILNYNGAGQLLQTTPFMTGAGSFIKEGTGDVVMNQTSTYTGGTTIRAGRIGLNNGNALGTGTIQIDAGAELGIGNIALLNNISGTGTIVKTASSTADLGGDNSGFTGTIDLRDGRISVTDGRSLGSGTVLVGLGTILRTDTSIVGDTTIVANLSGDGEFEKRGSNQVTLTGANTLTRNVFVRDGTLQIEGSQNIGSANIDLTLVTSTLNLSTAGSTILSNNVGGLGGVVKTGTGTVFMTGANTYTGGTDIQQGAIRVTDLTALGTGPVAVQFGAALDLSISGAATYNGAISGAGILRKSDVGDLTLISNTLTGGLDIVGGRVIVNDTSALGAGNVTTAADTQLVVDNATTQGLSTLISGAGALTKNGTGLLAVNNANSYTCGTIVNAGRLVANDSVAFGSGSVLILQDAEIGIGGITLANTIQGAGRVIKTANNNGTLTGINSYSGGTDIQGGTLTVTNPVALGSGGVTMASGTALIVNYNGSTNVAMNNVLSGAGALVKDGSGAVIINTAGNSFSGGTTINAGRLGLNFGDGLGTGGVIVAAGAQLAIGGVTVANTISGAGQVVKTSSNTGSLTGINSYSGGTDIQGGTLLVSDPAALGSGGVTMAAGATLNINYGGATNVALNNLLSGAGSLVKDGIGTLVINTAGNSYSGGTTINAGRLGLNFGDGLGTGAVVIGSGASLALGDVTYANATSGAGQIVKTSAGLTTLTGTNTHSGGTDVLAGTLSVNSPVALGSGAVTLASGSVLDFNYLGSANVALDNVVSGAGSVTKNGSGTVVVNNGNSFSGGTTINAGTLGLNFGNGLGTGAVVIGSGASLALGDVTYANATSGAGQIVKTSAGVTTLTGTNTHSGGTAILGGQIVVNSAAALGTGPVSTATGAQLVFDTTGNLGSSVVITGTGGLVKRGTGLLAINNANSYSGGTTISAGRLVANAGGAFGTGTVTIAAGAEMGIGGVSIGNSITGAGRVIKTANNAGQLTGTNSYSGGTDIQGGTLIISGPAALGSGAVSMAGGTTLQVDLGSGSATLANQLTGAGALVMNGAGSLTVTGSNSYSGGTLVALGRLTADSAGALGSGAVQVNSGAQLGVGDVSFANNVSGAGQIVKAGSGLTSLTGTNSHGGGTLVQAGTLAVTGNGALGSGAVTVSAGAILDYTASTGTTFSNGLSGAGTFRKLGTGALSFANNFSIGLLDLQAGATRINSVATGNVTVAAPARLDGTGRIIGNLTNNGIVAPGNSIGTMTVQGNYTHNANSVLEIEFDGAGNIDLLDVTGNATLNGGTIRFLSIGGAEGQGGTFLRTGGTVTGTFTTVETVGALLPLSVVYEANRAFMAPSVLTARPSTFNAQSMAAADTALGFIDSIGVGDVRHGSGNRIWMSGFGAWGKRSASGTTLAYDHDSRGLSGGVNFDVGSSVTLGAAIGWAKGDITLGAGGGGGDQKSLLGSLTARYVGTGFTLGGGVLLGKVDQETLRNVSFNGFAGSVSGATDSKVFGAFAELGLPLGSSGGWAFSSHARGSFIRQKQDGYTELGTSPLRLQLDDLSTRTLEGEARLTAKTRLWAPEQFAEETREGLEMRFDLGGRYLGTLGDRLIPVKFAVSNAGIVLQGDTRNTLQGVAGVALDYTTRSNVTLSLGYRGEFGKTDRHSLQAGVSFAF